MYGTIAKMRMKPGGLEALRDRFEGREPPDGAVASYLFQMDANPSEYYLVAVSESEEAYRASSESPEMHQNYVKMLKWLEGEPEWHDGKIVHAEQA